MPRIVLRSHVNSLRLSDNYGINDTTSAENNSEKIQRKTSVSKVYENELYDSKAKLNYANNTKKTHLTPISIVCSLPLYKISGILEKINRSDSNNTGISYKYTKKLSKDNDQIIKPCMKILCLYCDKIFSSQIIQKKHVEKMHTLSKTRRYSSRNSNMYLSDSKHQHNQSSSSIMHSYSECCYCKNTKGHSANAKDFMELFLHMVDYHSEKYFGCKLCILRFQNRGKLTKHMDSVHTNPSFVIDENWKSKNESHSDRHKISQNQHCTSQPQSDFLQCKIDCINVMKNTMFSGDEPILSRLGVAQNRLPSNRKSIRHCRNGVLDTKSDHCPISSKIRNKIGKIVSTGDTFDVVFRVPTRNDMSCLFEDDFYVNIISNVRDNILYYLDGKIMGYTPEPHSFNKGSQYFHSNHTQIHKATQISTSTAFPTLLTSEQYGVDISTKLKRSITKHSWKWKWDSFKKFKFVNEGGKIIKKIKQPILNLRDLSKLDMWTQLTMRQKDRLYTGNSFMSPFSGNNNILFTEQRFNNQLNDILDARILPEIILEQNDQTIIKLERSNYISSTEGEYKSSIEVANSIELQNFCSILNLLPAKKKTSKEPQIILSGEWARPRCYLCIGCGTKFEKLKSLEEHKMFRHSHVYSTHYEIVGRELMACNLLKHFFIPKRAFNRYDSTISHPRKHIRNKNSSYQINVLPEDESFDSIQSILNSCTTTNCEKNSTDDYDTDFKLTMHPSAISPTPSIQSASASDSISSLQIKLNKDIDTSISCTKCRRKCSGVYDLYRHMLDCSGDYIWSIAKKRRYRYYCGSKKRRQCNKTYNKVLKKKQQKSLKDSSICTEENPTLLKPKTPPRQRPSDAESIKKMLENLPPKRVCKKILPTLSKTRKSRLMVKRKIFNSQALKHKLSKRIRQTSNLMYKVKCKISANTSNVIFNNGEKADQMETLSLRKKNNGDPRFSEQKIESESGIEFQESSRKLLASNIISANENNIILATSLLSSKFNCVTQEPRQLSQSFYNGSLRSSVNGCKNQEVLRKSHFPAAELLPSNLEHSNYKKKRSKKINDCIAMLTGKLKEKLKTENVYECKGNDMNNLNSKKNVLPINKTAKRKTRSRKIVKLIADNSTEKITEDYTSVDNRIFDKTNLNQTSTTKKMPVQNYNVFTPYKEKKLQLRNNLAVTNELSLVDQDMITNRLFVGSDIPSICSLNPRELPRQLYIPPFNSLHSHNTQILPRSFSQQIATPSTYIKHNIPARRQTICGDEGINFLNKSYDDIRPLDLTTKTKEMPMSNLSEVASSSAFICQTSNSEPLGISSKLNNEQFYSNLELLKIPQVKNPCCFNTNIENYPKVRITSKIKENNKNASEYLTNGLMPTPSLYEFSLNTRNPYVIKKENCIKSKNSPKMNEVVIGHINDAINSVINAENEKDKLENTQSNIERGEKFNELLHKPQIKDSRINKLTPLKRCMRSKTVDNPSSDNTDNNFLCIDVDEFSVSNEINSKDINYNINEKVSSTTSSNPAIYRALLDLNVAIDNSPDNTIIKPNKLEPIQKQKRKRKNELAAIVADQLLESFKIDKVQRDNLKKLENLANEKSENLLTEVLLMSTTKRNASATLTRGQRLNDNIGYQIAKSIKERKQDQCFKNKTSKPIVPTTVVKDVLFKEMEVDTPTEKEHSLKKVKKKSVKNNVKSVENENINKLKTSLESFTLNSIKKNSDTSSDLKIVHISIETSDDNLSASLSKRNSILRPSILSKTITPSNVLKHNKTIIYSRDPRLNKNIHKEGNASDFPSSFPRNRIRSSNKITSVNKTEGIFDTEEDNYLHEIARNVNEKILSSENGDFKFVHDEFEVESICPGDSISKYCRPSTSMSACSAPNLTNDCEFGPLDENTNTELIDMDIDMDNLSVYTSFSQDVNRGNRRKKRRRSILLSRKQKKKIIREGEEKFECFLCKKSFYASSSLTKHQTTIAHVSKVSEQEYFFSKTKSDTSEQFNSFSFPEKKRIEGVTVQKDTFIKLVEDEDKANEYSKGQSDYFSLPRLTLNPDEKLFFECCNILKGSQTGKTENYQDLSTYLEKNGPQISTTLKTNEPLASYCSKQNATEKSKGNSIPQSKQQGIFQDPFNTNLKKIEDIHTGTDQNTSRFKTKAAMKGYENISSLKMDHDTGGEKISECKLTALAEIALGNENTHNLTLENKGRLIHNNISESFGKDTNEIINAGNLDYSKEDKKNSTYSTTSSKTIMHFSILKTSTNQQEVKIPSDKIIIPERPFKNIGLEEKEGIQFQRPKTNASLIHTDNNSLSITSYSDRDDFDFGSLSCEKTDKDNCTSNSSSGIVPRTFENKSLIMDRIFKNANGKNKKETTVNCRDGSKDLLPKSDINRIFDELKGNPIKKIKKTEYCENKILHDEGVDRPRVLSNKQATKRTKRCNQSSNEKQRSKTHISRLQSELGMSTEEIAQLINEGQRKSKRRCATNRSKKLVEMWSSDEYEEFLSTKDIFALIEEKEKEEKKRKRKGSFNTIKGNVDITIDNTKKCILKNSKASSNVDPLKMKTSKKVKVEQNNTKKFHKKESTNLVSVSKKLREAEICPFTKGRKTRLKRPNGNNGGYTHKVVGSELSKQINPSNKASRCRSMRSQTTISNSREKRLASEKLYYWSSSSDEDFGRIKTTNAKDFESGEQYEKHGWIVGDSHKKLVKLLAIAKGNKKVEDRGVKKGTTKKKC